MNAWKTNRDTPKRRISLKTLILFLSARYFYGYFTNFVLALGNSISTGCPTTTPIKR